jgi:hypothetical protein
MVVFEGGSDAEGQMFRFFPPVKQLAGRADQAIAYAKLEDYAGRLE